MKRALVYLIGLIFLAGAGFYWFSTQRIEDQLERVASQLSPIGRLSWGSVFIDPRGRAIINDLRFLPHQDSDPIRIDRVSVKSSNLFGLMALAPALSRGELPAQGSLRVSGLRLPMNPLFSEWSLEWTGLLLPLRSQGCVGFEQMTIGQLLDLDYGQLEIDAALDFQIRQERLEIGLQIATSDLSDTRYAVTLRHAEPISRFEQLADMAGRGQLVKLDYNHSDRGLMHRLDQRCLDASPAQAADPLKSHFAAWIKAWTDFGMEPTQIVKAGYQHYLQQAGPSISLSATPESAIPLARFKTPEVQRLIQDLNLRFSIDQGPMIELATRPVQSTRTKSTPSDSSSTGPQIAIRRSTDQTETAIVVGRAPEWKTISFDLVSEHVGDQARIELIDGTRLKGRIAGGDEAQLQLLARSLQGEFTRPITWQDILSIEVRP